MHHGSTRISIVTQSLTDTLERLREMPASPRVRELRAKALSYEKVVRGWNKNPPTPEQRAAMVRLVLELNVEVMAAGRNPEQPPGS